MSKQIQPIHYDEQNVGRRIKSTKKHYLWKFSLDKKIYSVDLFASRISGKKKIKIDGEVRFEGKKQGKIFHISIDIGNHSVLIIEVGKGYDLRIDGISFQILQKQAIFSPNIDEIDSNTMSDKLIPDNQEDWETNARPYKIIIREGLNSTTREVLPIVKKSRVRHTLYKPNFDSRFIFTTGIQQDNLFEEETFNKPRSQSNFSSPFLSSAENPFF